MIKSAALQTVRLSYLFCGVLLILLALFTVTARVGLPLLASQKSTIEQRVSDYLKSPVEIGDLSLRWEGSGPRLYATDVAVLETTERKVALDELLIDINLPKSLLRGIPVINELSLVGASLAIEADAAGQLRLHGMDSLSGRPDAVDVLPAKKNAKGVDVVAWLFNANKVGLLDTQLTLIDLKTNRQVVIENLNIRAESYGSTRQLRIDAQLPATLGGRVEAGIDLNSKTRDLANSNGNLFLAANSLNIRAISTLLRMNGFITEEQAQMLAFSATASVEVWGEWKEGRLVSVRGPVLFEHIVERETGDVLFEQAAAQMSFAYRDGLTEYSIKKLRAATGSRVLQIEELTASRLVSAESDDIDAPVAPTSVSAVQADNSTELQGADSSAEESPLATIPSSELQSPESAAPKSAAAKSQIPAWNFGVLANELPADLTARLVRMALKDSRQSLQRSRWNLSAGGVVRDLSLDMVASATQPLLNVMGRFDAVEIRAEAPFPAIGPISGNIAIADSVGTITLQAEHFPLSAPASNDETLVLDSLEATVDIDVRDPKRLQAGADIRLADDGIDTKTRLSASWTPGSSPHLDIQSQFEVEDITALKSWLPRKSLNRAATDWIDRSINAGKASNGTLLFFGHVADFPFKEGEGVFRASTDISGAELAFLPGWPAATNINGSLELDGLRLSGLADAATLARFNVSQAHATIDNLTIPVLEFDTTADGDFDDIVEFAVNGPLSDILSPAIGDLKGNGTAQMDLDLAVSLYKKPAATADSVYAQSWRPFQVNGAIFFDGNEVMFGRAGLQLDNASGAVGFNNHGININRLSGQVLGHDVRISGKTVGEGLAADTTITINGVMEANDLLAHYGNPLDQFIVGGSQWTATINVPHSSQRIISDGVSLDVSSDLFGSQLLLPKPFDKSGSVSVPFSLQTAFREDASEQIWEAHYGNELSASVRVIDDNMHSLLIELGEARLTDSSAVLEQPGIRLQGSVKKLAADGWISTIGQYIDSIPDSDGEPELILPVSASLDTVALMLGGRSLGKASLQTNTDDTYLNFTVSNRALAGNMRYPRKHWEKDTALKTRIELLDWEVIDALNDDTQTDDGTRTTGLDPRMLPPIEARISALVIDNVRVRDLVLRAYPNVSGIDITTLGFAYDTMRLVGQGHWYLRDPQNVNAGLSGKHQTKLALVLQSDDFGTGLDEVGLTDIIDEAQGSIEMKLSWPGPLYSPEIANLDGDIVMNLQDGSIIPFEPGAGRMMGLFAIQALPRRLNLDFRDMTGDGLAFETITGSAVINNGLAHVPLLQLTGPIGVVDIAGHSDLNTRQFDQQVTVLPRVSAALPIIGAISGGASAGIGALVAAGFLKALGVDFDRLGLRRYALTGPWGQPEFTAITSDYSRQR